MKHNNKGIASMTLAALVVAIVVVGGISYVVMTSDGGDSKPQLIQTGSSTVLPLAIQWAEDFQGAEISVSGGGSSHGLNALLNGEADLGDASRLMKGKDYEKVDGDGSLVQDDGTATGAAPTGVWPHKWIVAYDVLSVVVNNENTWATELNYDQLYEIFTDDNPVEYWDEVTGLEGAPHELIEIYAPDEASGTYDYFFEEIIDDWGDDGATSSRLDLGDGVYHPSADDNVILTAITDNPYAIGYFGFAYYQENPDKVQKVDIAEEGTDYQEASLTNVANYPMSRPLHIYTDGIPGPGDVVNDYLKYILGPDGQAIVPDVGYVKLELVSDSLASDQLAKLD